LVGGVGDVDDAVGRRLYPLPADEECVGVAQRSGSWARYGHPRSSLVFHGQRYTLVVTLRLDEWMDIGKFVDRAPGSAGPAGNLAEGDLAPHLSRSRRCTP